MVSGMWTRALQQSWTILASRTMFWSWTRLRYMLPPAVLVEMSEEAMFCNFFYLTLRTSLKYCKCKIQRKILCCPFYSAKIYCKYSKDGRSANKSRKVGKDMQPRQVGEGSGKLYMPHDSLERQVRMGTKLP